MNRTHQAILDPRRRRSVVALCGQPHQGRAAADVTLALDPCPDCLFLIRTDRALTAGDR